MCVMVLGTTSGAGKSWITTALCRYYAQQGLKVVPFKAQNVSNNARVVAPALHCSHGLLHLAEGASVAPLGGLAANRGLGYRVADRGGEIGSAQYFQALAAKAKPDVRMNPVLVKPEPDFRSQVVLMGEVNRELSDMPWRDRGEKMWPHVTAALDALRAENDLVVIEGGGSPAEINLRASDIVNMRIARHAQARCLLVSDIDRGGAFAHLYGTWALLPEDDSGLIKGFVLNKFSGDALLLAPAPQRLLDMTGVPVVATLPMWQQHGLPEEDGVFDDKTRVTGVVSKTIAVIAYPCISNLDEFQPLKNVPGVRLIWARTPADCAGVDWIVLPGSKATAADLAWLRVQGLDRVVAVHATQGGAVLGICGGLQMLGEVLIDTHGIESTGSGNARGLGLLPLRTAFDTDKTVCSVQACFSELTGIWSALSGTAIVGYEIHHGQTTQHLTEASKGNIAREVVPGLAWQNAAGNVLGCYLHGLFENPTVLRALFGSNVPTLDSVFDGLANFIDSHFAPGVLTALLSPHPTVSFQHS